MKIKFLKDSFGRKVDEVVEYADAEAKFMIDGGFAEEVKADALDAVVGDLEKKISEAAEQAASKAATAAVEKIAKGVGKVRPTIIVGPDRIEDDPHRGFKTFTEFAKSVKRASKGLGVDQRLKGLYKTDDVDTKTAGATPTESGAADADGGATLPPGFSAVVFDGVKGSDQLFPYIDALPITTRTMTIPVVKHYDFSNTTATAGLVATYRTEGDIQPGSKMQWEKLSFSLKTLAALVPSTEELEEDTGVALGQFLQKEGARQINETISNNILNTVSGGVSPILGDASVHQSLRTTSNNIDFLDVVRVFARFYGDYSRAVWIVHPTTLPELADISSGNQNMFTPAGVQGFPFNQLMGRPLIISQYAATLGSDGDLGLYDLSKYKAVYRSDGVSAAMSMHLYFDSFQNAYRFAFRWDAKPGLTTQITLKDGTTKVSPFSILNASGTES